MKKIYKRIVSLVLVAVMLVCSNLPVFAAEVEEEYLSDLRLIYADNYDEAKEALVGSDFEDYKVFNANLNDDTDEIGVWLAYKTTTDIDDAITDISIMQMDGGYKEGNYQEMIKESLAEYEEMGENYVQAIDYFIEAYDEGHFLAELAYRQLNFYTSITDESLGIEIPDFDGEPLGDVFYDGITASELATIFMEGNSYALDNIRSLLAMGVSYNEDGMHYLEKVAEAVELLKDGEDAFEDHDYYDDFDDLAFVISGSIKTFREMFEKLAAYEGEMNYYDDEVTELELEFVEHKALADRLREVAYLDGKSLYDFCLEYEYDEDDFTPLYPLVYALNVGQVAMVKVARYGDVVRYSMTDYPEEELIAEVERLEEIYSENPFNVYTGVDRSIYYGTFALTSDAYRQDAYTGEGLLSHLFVANGDILFASLNSGISSIVFGAWAVSRTQAALEAKATVETAKELIEECTVLKTEVASNMNVAFGGMPASDMGLQAYGSTVNDVLNTLMKKAVGNGPSSMTSTTMSVSEKIRVLSYQTSSPKLTPADVDAINSLKAEYSVRHNDAQQTFQDMINEADDVVASNSVSKLSLFGTGVLYVVSAALMLYTAYNLGHTVWSYYHPEYEDIPVALVDLIETTDGDRYIKYDAVFNAETNDDGVYEVADLNSFTGQRWNALYYTKSYEAGKPLLADAFTVSASNSTPREGYTPVHRFGEVVCYNLNKYTYGFTPSIYLSVKQSKNDKSAVADVPQVVGSMVGTGFIFLAGGIGAALGVCGTIATNHIIKKKKATPESQAPAEDAAGE